MLNLLNNIISNLSLSGENGKKVFTKLIYLLVEEIKIPETNYVNKTKYSLEYYLQGFERFNNNYDTSFKYYFLNLYQILNYISKNSTKKYSLKEYTNIVRAQLSKNELILLFFNAIGVTKFTGNNYKVIVEKYALFEHLTYEDLIKFTDFNKKNCLFIIQELVDILIVEYNPSAFGKNNEILEKINKLKEKDNKAQEKNK